MYLKYLLWINEAHYTLQPYSTLWITKLCELFYFFSFVEHLHITGIGLISIHSFISSWKWEFLPLLMTAITQGCQTAVGDAIGYR